MAIGEAGSITTNSPTENQPITVTFTEPMTNPVFALSATNNGGDQFVLRVVGQTLDGDGNTTAFTFIIEEWEYHDGPHGATETINWLAIEEGVHTLPDGRVIEAGTSSVSSSGRNTGINETFSAGFTDPPVVLTSVMSENDTTAVDSDPSNITSSGFRLTLQEEEAENGVHAAETIGWIAIQAGGDATSGTATTHNGVDENVDVLGLGATFTDSVVLAETQTINGGDTATVVIDSQSNSDVGVFIEEEQSANNETGHVNETVGIIAFEDGLIPCFTTGTRILTPSGPVAIEQLKTGDLVETADSGPRKITWMGRQPLELDTLAEHENLRPVRILTGALGHGLPQRDLLVSRQHRMLISSQIAERMFGEREVLVAAIKLIEMPGIYVDEALHDVEYVHILLEGHEIVFAEGARTETLYTGAEALNALSPESRAEVLALFPELALRSSRPEAARYIPTGRRQERLVGRHLKNNKPFLN